MLIINDHIVHDHPSSYHLPHSFVTLYSSRVPKNSPPWLDDTKCQLDILPTSLLLFALLFLPLPPSLYWTLFQASALIGTGGPILCPMRFQSGAPHKGQRTSRLMGWPVKRFLIFSVSFFCHFFVVFSVVFSVSFGFYIFFLFSLLFLSWISKHYKNSKIFRFFKMFEFENFHIWKLFDFKKCSDLKNVWIWKYKHLKILNLKNVWIWKLFEFANCSYSKKFKFKNYSYFWKTNSKNIWIFKKINCSHNKK
jgi:hypothetical protein